MKYAIAAALSAALLLPAPARAGSGYAPGEPRRLEIELNFGVGGYFGRANAVTGTGPAYGVIAGLARSPTIAYELGYMGHSSDVESSDRRLTSNKLQADVRAGPQLRAPVPWRPYAFGGLGANFVTAGTSAFGLSNAVQAVVPVGVGADFFTQSPVHVGARGTYDWTPGIGSEVAPGAPHPDEWQATLTATAAF